MIQIDLNKPPKKALVFVVLGLAMMLWILVRFTGPKPEVAQPGTLPRISLQKLAAESPPKAKPEGPVVWSGSWGRDPFALPFNIVLQREPEVERPQGEVRPLPKLTAIIIGGSRRLAVIDNLVLGVGDQIHGERVVKISSDRVILAGPRGRSELLVPAPQTAVGSRLATGDFDLW